MWQLSILAPLQSLHSSITSLFCPAFPGWESWNYLVILQRGIIYTSAIKSLLNFPWISWNLNNGGKHGTNSQEKWTKCFSTSCISMEKSRSLLMQSECVRKRETLSTSLSLLQVHLFHNFTSLTFPCEIIPAFSLLFQKHRQCPTLFRDGKSTALLISPPGGDINPSRNAEDKPTTMDYVRV